MSTTAWGMTAVLDQVDRYAQGELTYAQLRQWIAVHSPVDPEPVPASLAARYKALCGTDLPRQADVGGELSEAERAGLLTETEAADLYDAWSNP